MHKRQQWNFNPRSHERSDFDTSVTVSPIPYISIHAPTRGATVTFVPLIVANCIFQSTLPREERLCMFRHATPYPHFNPRSHERSDHYGVISLVEFFISIHAPTRGATVLSLLIIRLNLFQSTLPREERQCIPFQGSMTLTFQSTLPREERRFTTLWQGRNYNISIHAPTRGATVLRR